MLSKKFGRLRSENYGYVGTTRSAMWSVSGKVNYYYGARTDGEGKGITPNGDGEGIRHYRVNDS